MRKKKIPLLPPETSISTLAQLFTVMAEQNLELKPILNREEQIDFWVVGRRAVDSTGWRNYQAKSARGITPQKALERYIARKYWIVGNKIADDTL